MEVYLIRHGESEANFNGTHSGWAPISLTERGRAQALAARKYVEHVHFDRLFVSDIRRAQQTANLLFPGLPRTFLPIAREINNSSMQGKNREEMTALFPDLYPACREKFDYSPLPGMDCESQQHMQGRAQEMLDMLSALPGAERVAVVCHAGFLGAVLCRVLGLPNARRFLCDNASVSILRYDEKGWRVKMWNLAPELSEGESAD